MLAFKQSFLLHSICRMGETIGNGELETYYSFANIRADNNSLKWSDDGGQTWTALHIPTGCSEIIRMREGNSDITMTTRCSVY